MKELLLWANYYYHRFGFNITYMNPVQNILLGKKKPYKSPTNDRNELGKKRQAYSELLSFDWHRAKGIGTVTGFNNLRVLDFDNIFANYVSQSVFADLVENFAKEVLKMLRLPENYQWVIKTGSNTGFHIVVYSSEHSYNNDSEVIKVFFPNSKYVDYFERLDLLWNNHLILPPSLHKSENVYSFTFCDLPTYPPHNVDINQIKQCINELCYEDGGYNTRGWSCSNSIDYEKKLDADLIIVNQTEYDKKYKNDLLPTNSQEYSGQFPDYDDIPF